MLRQVDHLAIVVPDLSAAIAQHRERGFTVTPGGTHAGGETHNALIPFADGSYLELVAFVDTSRPSGHRWAPFARTGGLADFALLSDDLDTDVAALAELAVGVTTEGGRVRPDGVTIRWRTCWLTPPLPFLIEDLTPRELRVPSGSARVHPNGATGIARIVIGARDLALAKRRYAALRERGAPGVELQAADRDLFIGFGVAGVDESAAANSGRHAAR